MKLKNMRKCVINLNVWTSIYVEGMYQQTLKTNKFVIYLAFFWKKLEIMDKIINKLYKISNYFLEIQVKMYNKFLTLNNLSLIQCLEYKSLNGMRRILALEFKWLIMELRFFLKKRNICLGLLLVMSLYSMEYIIGK